MIDNILKRMYDLCADGRSEDASALYSEIQEWVISELNTDIITLDYIEGVLENE
jgi:hypothetical protein